MTGILVGDLATGGRRAHDRGVVLILAQRRGSGHDAGHGCAHGQRVLGAGDGADFVVGDRHVGQGHTARIGDNVGPGDRRADFHHRAGGRVCILTVGRFLDVNGRCVLDV